MEPQPEYSLLVPEMILAALKLIIDIGLMAGGVYYFIKFRKIK